jgi:hypothetical protein
MDWDFLSNADRVAQSGRSGVSGDKIITDVAPIWLIIRTVCVALGVSVNDGSVLLVLPARQLFTVRAMICNPR